jgi:hypothetical protein
MADKKVDRYRPERTVDAPQKLKFGPPDAGAIDAVGQAHERGGSALLDKFRRREERWRLEQSLRDREAAETAEPLHRRSLPGPVEQPEPRESDEGGAR